jgi:hypothetical protein
MDSAASIVSICRQPDGAWLIAALHGAVNPACLAPDAGRFAAAHPAHLPPGTRQPPATPPTNRFAGTGFERAQSIEQLMSCPQHSGDLILPWPLGHLEI